MQNLRTVRKQGIRFTIDAKPVHCTFNDHAVARVILKVRDFQVDARALTLPRLLYVLVLSTTLQSRNLGTVPHTAECASRKL